MVTSRAGVLWILHTVVQGLACSLTDQNVTSVTPIVLWHGMGDCCCNPFSMGSITKYLEKKIPGVYVHSLMIGDNVVQDTENGFFLNINTQIELACQKIQADPNLQDGYHAVGFSQGGLFFRGLAQRCPQPRIKNLVSIGGPQQGVYGLPKCLGENHLICDYARRLLNYGAYIGWIQRLLVQAQYWHDPLAEQEYADNSLFLADINNQGSVKNLTYKENLEKLDNLVLVKFSKDTVVDPKGSEWFGWFSSSSPSSMVPLQQTPLYQEDWLGLKVLDKLEKLHLMSVDGDHLQLDQESLDHIIETYLQV
eukprot:GFUD01014936.1.p1 GENE.GFUD01014936.1~~GFUD01014936.1.p1  ORF type:complete len:308 (-),score=78.98 GFUD01014936.1:58-981(-)